MEFKNELYHHGIRGQRWGERNGPPYPLKSSSHSSSEKKAGWKKSLNSSNNKASGKHRVSKRKLKLSPKQKKAIIAGAAAVGAGLTAYGLYKTGVLNNAKDYIRIGKKRGNFLVGGIATDKYEGIRILTDPESLRDSVLSTNPHRGEPGYANNCGLCAICGIIRQNTGLDIKAGKEPRGLLPGGLVEELYPGIWNMKVDVDGRLRPREFDGSAITFGKSKNDAAKFLVKRFGQNAEGICGIQWKKGSRFTEEGDPGGHIFSWKIKDGRVLFIDYQRGKAGRDLDADNYWAEIDPNKGLYCARLDGLDPDPDAVKKYFEF